TPQLELDVPAPRTHGGRRPGAGRPRSGRREGVPHTARPFHDKHNPEHVTWRIVAGPAARRPRAPGPPRGHTDPAPPPSPPPAADELPRDPLQYSAESSSSHRRGGEQEDPH